jgi:hypothetical protein
MILSAPVSFKLAKLLKRKKYKNTTPNKLSRPYYNHLGVLNGDMTEYITAYIAKKNTKHLLSIDAPTIGEVIDWLFEECGIWVSVKTIKWNYEHNTIRFNYNIVKFNDKNPSNIINVVYKFNTPTEAYENAITYCLNKLIKNGKKI